MSKNQDRYKRFKKSFAKTDMSDIGFKRIEGVNGRLLDLNEYLSDESHKKIIKAEKNGYRKYHYELTRGAVGCYLSHLNCYKEIATQKEEYGIIFEDDVKILKPNLLNDINTVIELIPSDWDILLLGCVCFVCGKSSKYYDVNRYFLMHSYIVKKSSARKILHILENEPIEQQIDAKFSDLTEKGLLKIYCLRNKLAVQWDMGTNIQLPVKNIDGVNPFDAIIN
jgi:GR25 family glycosyltransferase involved in LPS biosynthesis